VPREIPDAERPELTLSEDQKKAIERALSEDQKKAIERARQQPISIAVGRAARNIPIGQRPAPRPSAEPGATEKLEPHLPPKAKPKARSPNKRKKRKRRTPSRRGRPRDFTHEQIRDLAEGYIKDHGLPRTRPGLKPSLRALCKKVKDTCPIKLPKRTQLQKILRPVFGAALQKWSLNQK
jgi:hypothetical protein